MSIEQKKTAWIILVLGILYFVLLAIPNATGAADEHMLFVLSTDEHITYPYTLHMVTPGETIGQTLYQWIAYQDYHYGYPFYLLSALVLLPVRLVLGDQITAYTQLNLWLLRQFINVIPMTLSISLLVYLQTRFQSRLKAAALFIFLATIQGVFRSNICWWHPDSLAILAATLTFFFLDRDRLRFGRNFFLAAAACGLATGIKVFGLFFFLTIGGYVLAGLYRRVLPIKRSIIVSALFLLVMGGTLVASNPLLIPERSRNNILAIQAKIRSETSSGWADQDTYQTGLASWMPYLDKWYGKPYFLIFALVSLAAGSLFGRNRTLNRLILAWVIPYGLYLTYFVAVKPDHYWLPVMLPAFSSIFALLPIVQETLAKLRWQKAVITVLIAGIALQFAINLVGDARLYNSAMIQEWLLYHNIHND